MRICYRAVRSTLSSNDTYHTYHNRPSIYLSIYLSITVDRPRVWCRSGRAFVSVRGSERGSPADSFRNPQGDDERSVVAKQNHRSIDRYCRAILAGCISPHEVETRVTGRQAAGRTNQTHFLLPLKEITPLIGCLRPNQVKPFAKANANKMRNVLPHQK